VLQKFLEHNLVGLQILYKVYYDMILRRSKRTRRKSKRTRRKSRRKRAVQRKLSDAGRLLSSEANNLDERAREDGRPTDTSRKWRRDRSVRQA
jgi:hypothetical protein